MAPTIDEALKKAWRLLQELLERKPEHFSPLLSSERSILEQIQGLMIAASNDLEANQSGQALTNIGLVEKIEALEKRLRGLAISRGHTLGRIQELRANWQTRSNALHSRLEELEKALESRLEELEKALENHAGRLTDHHRALEAIPCSGDESLEEFKGYAERISGLEAEQGQLLSNDCHFAKALMELRQRIESLEAPEPARVEGTDG